MEKIRLIYILGSGYSGSTILDLLLGSHSEIESLGEFLHYEDVVKNNGICTCWKKINDCPYWQEVRKIYDGLISKSGVDFRDNQILKDYFMFKAILIHTGKKIIVDSSKRLDRFKLLFDSGLFDIKLIYLIRECQGFMYSGKKRNYTGILKTNLNENGTVNSYVFRRKKIYDGPLKTGILWFFENWEMINFLNKINPENRITVRYNDLALNPEKELLRICKIAGIDFEENMLNYSAYIHHNIGGNPTRMRKKDASIKYDDRWKTGLSKYELLMAMFFNHLIEKKLQKVEIQK